VFEDDTLTYEEAMLRFVAASQEQAHQTKPERPTEPMASAAARSTKRALDRDSCNYGKSVVGFAHNAKRPCRPTKRCPRKNGVGFARTRRHRIPSGGRRGCNVRR
jgi:hypothetical protein